MSELIESLADRLTLVLDRLIPAEKGWPGAGALGLAEAVWNDAGVDGNQGGIAVMLAGLPPAFETMTVEQQTEALKAAEQAKPAEFGALWRHTINIYYAHPDVLAVVEQETGYPARPPLYMGYEMEPFDEAILAPQKAKPEFWRKT